MAQHRTELTTLDDVTRKIEQLKNGASLSIEAALNAQLQVIRYVNSPTLVDSSLDLLFENIRKAIKFSQSYEEEQKILEQGHLMINNYVFFMDAKLQYAINTNKEEGEELLKIAANDFVSTLASSAFTFGGNIYVAAGKIVNDIIVKSHKTGFFSRVVDWFFKEEKNNREYNQFLKTIRSLFEKLEKHQSLIGQSNIIGGLIERYAEDLAFYNTSHLNPGLPPMKEDVEGGFGDRGCAYFVIALLGFGGLIIADIIRSMGILLSVTEGGFLDYTKGYGKWLLLGMLGVEIFIRARDYLKFRKLKKNYEESYAVFEASLNEEYSRYIELANRFYQI